MVIEQSERGISWAWNERLNALDLNLFDELLTRSFVLSCKFLGLPNFDTMLNRFCFQLRHLIILSDSLFFRFRTSHLDTGETLQITWLVFAAEAWLTLSLKAIAFDSLTCSLTIEGSLWNRRGRTCRSLYHLSGVSVFQRAVSYLSQWAFLIHSTAKLWGYCCHLLVCVDLVVEVRVIGILVGYAR